MLRVSSFTSLRTLFCAQNTKFLLLLLEYTESWSPYASLTLSRCLLQGRSPRVMPTVRTHANSIQVKRRRLQTKAYHSVYIHTGQMPGKLSRQTDRRFQFKQLSQFQIQRSQPMSSSSVHFLYLFHITPPLRIGVLDEFNTFYSKVRNITSTQLNLLILIRLISSNHIFNQAWIRKVFFWYPHSLF